MTDLTARDEEALYERVAQIIEAARVHVSRTVDTAMVHAYWLIGREVVEVEQAGKERAEYGRQLIERLAKRLSTKFGKGFSPRTLRRIRQFYLIYPEGSTSRTSLAALKNGQRCCPNWAPRRFGQRCCPNLPRASRRFSPRHSGGAITSS